MIKVLLVGFDPYCGGKLLLLRNEFAPSIKLKKNVYKSNEQILKNQIFSKTAQPMLMTKTCYREY